MEVHKKTLRTDLTKPGMPADQRSQVCRPSGAKSNKKKKNKTWLILIATVRCLFNLDCDKTVNISTSEYQVKRMKHRFCGHFKEEPIRI